MLRHSVLLLASFLLLGGRVEAQVEKPVEPYTLLNEVGRLAGKLPASTVSDWKAELHTPHLSAERAAHLHLWLGETELGQNEQPERALAQFQQALRLSQPSETVHTLAAYDSAIALFYEGAYLQSTNAFHRLLVSHASLPGLDRRRCALWWRHASACAGYHAERANLGIPEPRRLDPLCGVAALAACLRQRGLPSDKPALLSVTHVTGEGNSLQDIAQGARRLGAQARLVTADEKGLIALPKPLVAYVENDHFVAVVRADKGGVSYLCSDCGAWPGGQVDLTWKQWRKMEASLYLAVTKKQTASDRWLQAVLTASKTNQNSKRKLRSWTLADLGMKVPDPSTMSEHLVAYVGDGVMWCGTRPNALHCPSYIQCPMDGPGICDGAGSSAGDPVNLATGEEEYTPAPDLTVYNPNGPSLVWGRVYNSLRGLDTYYYPGHNYPQAYQYCDFGMGWSHTYNLGVIPVANSNYPFAVLVPNGGNIPVSSNNTTPTSTNPSIVCSVPVGVGAYVTYNYDPNTTTHLYFVITWPDRSQWITASYTDTGHGWYFPIKQIVDRMGNAINFFYDISADTSQQEEANFPLLTRITDKGGNVLLTITHDTVTHTANGRMVTYKPVLSVTDCYGRSVYYHTTFVDGVLIDSHFPQSYNLVDWVSQVVSTGTVNPPHRYDYGYTNLSNGEQQEQLPILTSISVPSPKNNGTSSTTTLHYVPGICVVDYIQDANGNQRIFSATDLNDTKVTVKDAQNNLVYSYTVNFDSQMRRSSITDGDNVVVMSWGYPGTGTDGNVNFNQTVDGNGKQTLYHWDSYGNLLSVTPPTSRAPTTYTYDYAPAYPLGRLTSVQTAGKQATTFTYDDMHGGLVSTIVSPLPGTVNGTQSVTTSFTYDSLGNVTSVTTPAANNTPGAAITTLFNYTTDGSYTQSAAIGQPITVTNNLGKVTHLRYYSPADTLANTGMLKSITDALGNQTAFAYNIANQTVNRWLPTLVTNPGPPVQSTSSYAVYTYQYPGGPLAEADDYQAFLPGGAIATLHQTYFAYGAEGETLAVTGSVEPVSYTYDAAYRLKTLTDGNSHTTTYAYNTAGYLSKISYPLVNGTKDTVSFTYTGDHIGNPTQRVDGQGVVTNYVYNDPQNLLTSVQYPATPALNVTLGYDTFARLSSKSDGAGSYTYGYDDLDLPTSMQTTYTGLPAQTLLYAYYPNGNRSSLTLPGTTGAFAYTYDGQGRLTGLSNPFSESFSWTYLDNDWLWTQTANGACKTTYTYNAWGLPTEILNSKAVGGATLSDFSSLGYDGVGNLKNLTASVPAVPAYSGQTNYSYTSRDQLTIDNTTRNGGYAYSFAYDAAGNPTTFRSQTATYNADNQHTGTGYIYDGNGNPLDYRSAYLCVFDPENRPTSLASLQTNGYMAEGLRAWKQPNGGAKTYYLYDGIAAVCELNSSGSITAVNSFGASGLVSRRVVGGSSVFYTFDASGNVSQEVDNAGNVLTSTVFDAFGQYGGSNPGVFGYGGQAGYLTDSETGLCLLGHRFYDAGTGRFLTRDLIGYDGGINLYGYVMDNPDNALDPSGLKMSKFECGQLFAGILIKVGKLMYEYSKYDPVEDGKGGHKYFVGGKEKITTPGGHYVEMRQLQRGIKNDITRYINECIRDNDDDNPCLPRFADGWSNRKFPLPVFPTPVPASTWSYVDWSQVGVRTGAVFAAGGLVLATISQPETAPATGPLMVRTLGLAFGF